MKTTPEQKKPVRPKDLRSVGTESVDVIRRTASLR